MIRTKSSDAGGWMEVGGQELIESAERQIRQGFAPPPKIYRIEYRQRVDWLRLPDWARPVDPQLFEGCCHEG